MEKHLNVFDRPRDHQLKRAAVLRAAANMFNKRGYAATSLDEIAAQFDITKTALYYYVGSKPVLLQRCYEETLDFCDLAMARARAEGPTGLDKLVTYARIMILEASEQCPSSVVTEFHCLPEVARSELHKRARQLDAELLAFIAEGMQDGSIAPVPAKTAELLLMGALNWINRWFEPAGPSTLEEIADCFVALFVNGLRGSGAPSSPSSYARWMPTNILDVNIWHYPNKFPE